ncbi:MAG: flagellar hook-length control protein FliK [Planctomycetes bacterium]|nr:flagellar hook-length control protein FliK [Planctomycetota bacterium]
MAPNTLMTELLRSPVAQRPAPPAISASTPRSGFQDYLDTIRAPQNIPTPPTGDPGPPRPRLPENPSAAAIDDDSSKPTRPSVESKDRKPDVTRSGKKSESKADTESSTSAESKAPPSTTDATSPGKSGETQPAANGGAPVIASASQFISPDNTVGTESSTEATGDVSSDHREGNVQSKATRGGLTDLVKALNLTPGKATDEPAVPMIPVLESVDDEAKNVFDAQRGNRNVGAKSNGRASDNATDESAASTDTKSERAAGQAIAQNAAHAAPSISRSTSELKSTRRQSVTNEEFQTDPRASATSQKVKINEAHRSEQESNAAANKQSDAQAHAAATSSQSRSDSGSSVLSLESVVNPADIKVANAVGDGAAATIGKFLAQEGDASTKTQSTPPTHGSISAVTTNSSRNADRVSSHATHPSTTVANLLTSGTTDADPIASTAQLLRAAGRDGHHQATLKLDPPELGQLRIDIRMREAGMTLRVDAENAAAAKLIESRLPELKDALSVHGIRVERSEIIVRNTDTGNDSTSQRDSRESQGDLNQQTHQQSSWFDERPSDSWRDQREWSPSHSTDNIAAAAAEASRRIEDSDVSLFGSVNLVA